MPPVGNFMCLVELEFAVRMTVGLPPCEEEYIVAEVVQGAGEPLLSCEVPSTRFDDVASVGEAQLIADNACAFHLCVGPATDQDWKVPTSPHTRCRRGAPRVWSTTGSARGCWETPVP